MPYSDGLSGRCTRRMQNATRTAFFPRMWSRRPDGLCRLVTRKGEVFKQAYLYCCCCCNLVHVLPPVVRYNLVLVLALVVLVVLESYYTQSQAVEVNEQAGGCCIVLVLILSPFPEAV